MNDRGVHYSIHHLILKPNGDTWQSIQCEAVLPVSLLQYNRLATERERPLNGLKESGRSRVSLLAEEMVDHLHSENPAVTVEPS